MAATCGRRSRATTWSGWACKTSSACMSSRAARAYSPRRHMANLQRKVVAFLEGRRTAEMADLIARHNGVPLAAPCLREVHSPDAPELQQSLQRMLDAPHLDVAVFLTGV